MALVRGAGFSSAVHEDPDFEHLRRNLDQAEELGAEFVELPLFGMDLIAGGKILREQVRRLKQVTEGRGCGYTVHGPIAVNFMATRDLVARHLAVAKASIEVAAEIGAVHVVLHTGHTAAGNEAEIEAAYARQREALTSLGDWAVQHSLIIAVENIFAKHPDEYTALPSRLAGEIDAIGHPSVRACLDFSHGALTCSARGADFFSEAKALARVARHLHLHDSFGDPMHLRVHSRPERVAYGLGDLHLPIGWGNIPWHRMMAEFAFEDDVIFNLELPAHFWFKLPDCMASVQALAGEYQAARANSA